MKNLSAKFIKGVIGSEGLPQPSLPTVAFFGRSNVGKSSVINSLVGQRGLARASSTQGRTTEINYFIIDNRWYLADLPGYGYAKVPQELRTKMEKHLSWYAAAPEVQMAVAVIIVDAEVGAKDSDRATYALLREYGRNVLLVANKCDKGRRNDIIKNLERIKQEFTGCRVIRYSAKTGEGREELAQALFS